jgi:hypothetical protein
MRLALVCIICFEIEWRDALHETIGDTVDYSMRRWHTCENCELEH